MNTARKSSNKILAAFDLETRCNVPCCKDYHKSMCAAKHSLNPWRDEITVIGIYDETGRGKVFRGSFAALSALSYVEKNGLSLVAHNGKFDLLHLCVNEPRWLELVDSWVGDTNLLAATSTTKIPDDWLDQYNLARGPNDRKGGKHGLKTLAPYHLGIEPFWEQADHDDDTYVLKDCEYTLRLYQKLMRDGGPEIEFVETKLLPWTKMVLEAELRGITVDVEGLEAFKRELEEKVVDMESRLNELWAPAHAAYAQMQRDIVNAKYDGMVQRSNTQANREKALDRVETRVNLASPAQVAWLLRDFLGYNITSLEGDQSTGKEVLERLAAQGCDDVKLFLDWRATDKLMTAFIPTYLDLQTNGVIHPSYNMALREREGGGESGTKTGRLSCIAEGQLVSGPGFDKPIEDIKVGDYVYAYTDDGKPTLSKVTAATFMGEKECISVKWQASGTGRIGELVCTPDHRIRTKAGEWKEASSLKRYEKLSHVYVNRNEPRPRVYGSNAFCDAEQRIIKREVFGADAGKHIHHIDENSRNNHLDNLIILNAKEHVSMHAVEYHKKNPDHRDKMRAKGTRTFWPSQEAHPCWISLSRFTVLKMLAKASGRPTLVDMDFDVFKRKAKLCGVNIKEGTKRYTADNKYLSRGALLKGLALGNKTAASKALRIGSRTFDSQCKVRGIEFNHAVCIIKPVGIKRTYDLTVEGTHNFIASEICVHNCEMPNIQQAPPAIKDFLRARPGYKFVMHDLSAVEMRAIALFTQDPVYFEIMQTGQSIHDRNVGVFLGIDTPVEDIKKLHPVERSASKNVGFALVFNAGANRIRVAFSQKGIMISESEARSIHKRWKQTYSVTMSYARELVEYFEGGGTTINLMGRPVGVENPQDCYMRSLNLLVQSSASDLLLEWSLRSAEAARAAGIEAHPLLFVHDMTGFEVREDQAEAFEKLLTDQLKEFTVSTEMGDVEFTSEGGTSDGWNKE